MYTTYTPLFSGPIIKTELGWYSNHEFESRQEWVCGVSPGEVCTTRPVPLAPTRSLSPLVPSSCTTVLILFVSSPVPTPLFVLTLFPPTVSRILVLGSPRLLEHPKPLGVSHRVVSVPCFRLVVRGLFLFHDPDPVPVPQDTGDWVTDDSESLQINKCELMCRIETFTTVILHPERR